MSAAPAISVLMPVHDCAAFVGEALRSVLRQTWRDFECLVLDDGSGDATASVAREASSGDPRVRIIHKRNTGLVDTLNYGLMQARAPVIARMDGDDECFPERFEVQLGLLRLGRCTAVSSSYLEIDEYGNLLGMAYPVNVAMADAEAIPAREPYLPHPFMMYLRDEVLEIGGYRHCLHSEDADLCWRLFERACLWNIPEVLGRYRLHLGSVSARSSANARVQAVSAQLAALSFRRRQAGGPDIAFDLTAAEALAAAASFETLLDLYSAELGEDELERVRLGAAIRFLDFSRFRKYPVEIDDVVFARRVLRRAGRRLGEGLPRVERIFGEALRNLRA